MAGKAVSSSFSALDSNIYFEYSPFFSESQHRHKETEHMLFYLVDRIHSTNQIKYSFGFILLNESTIKYSHHFS